MEKFEIRVIIKYFCKNGMPPKEIHEDFMVTHIAQRKNGQQNLRGGERALRMMDRLAAPKMSLLMKMSKVVHTLVMGDKWA